MGPVYHFYICQDFDYFDGFYYLLLRSFFSQSPSGHDFVENIKHKLWIKLPLDAVEITHGQLIFHFMHTLCNVD